MLHELPDGRRDAISRRVQTAYSAAIADCVIELETREHPIPPGSLAAW